MERKKHLFVSLFLFMSCLLYGQNNKTIYNAYLSGNMGLWKQAIDSIEALGQKNLNETLDLVNYQYGYIAWCIGNKKNDEAEKYLKKTNDLLRKLKHKKYSEPLLFAYQSACIGFEIGLAHYKAPFIGPRCLDYAKKSVKTDPLNAMGYMQLGYVAYYTPPLFGGSKTEALNHYLKALKLMEANSEYLAGNWNYLNLLVTLISAYIDLNQYEEAKKYCIKALAIEPGLDWVKNNLYPQVIKTAANE